MTFGRVATACLAVLVVVSFASCNNQFRFDATPLDAGPPPCGADGNVCGGCTADTACAPGQHCETTTGTCLFPCTEDAVCPLQAPACDEVRHLCIRCRRDDDCARDEPFCEAISGRCLACLSDDDCSAATPRCDRPLGGCVACITSGDCATPATCDPAAHICR